MLMPLITILHDAKVCTGNYEAQFVQLAQIQKCIFYTFGKLIASLEVAICLTVNGNNYSATMLIVLF